MARIRWDSRLVFIMAAVGSAVGLGNLWRFPYLVGEYGGAAFLLPYIILLFVVGIPLLVAEFYIGQRFQRAAVQGYAKVSKGIKGLGVAALLIGAGVISYYAAIIAWSWSYLVRSWTTPWAADTTSFFFENVLRLSDGPGSISGLVPELVFFLFLTWVVIYFCIFKGVKSVGKIVWLTVPLPVLLLFVLVIRGLTLEGMTEGLLYYIVPNFAALLDFDVWVAVAGQIFFTLTLGFGVMIAYASFNKEDQDFVGDGIWTACLNAGVSLVSGLAVFTTLGYMATSTGTAISELAASGPGLAFVVFPQALSLLPAGAGLFSVLFFITLLTLGIDSAFSIVEAINAGLKDRFKKVKTEYLSLVVCGVMFLAGLMFVTDAGLYLLDVVDHYLSSYGIITVGLVTSIALGWVYAPQKVIAYSKKTKGLVLTKWWSVSIKYIIPVVLVVLLVTSLIKDITTPYEGYPMWAQWIGIGAVGIPLLIGLVLSLKK